jgi:hypothetical protein
MLHSVGCETVGYDGLYFGRAPNFLAVASNSQKFLPAPHLYNAFLVRLDFEGDHANMLSLVPGLRMRSKGGS